VRVEQVGDARFLLDVLQQVQELGLYRHVEAADRLVADDQLRLERERPGDSVVDTLVLEAKLGVPVVNPVHAALAVAEGRARFPDAPQQDRVSGSPQARRGQPPLQPARRTYC
jgi:hypothetical protein